MSSSAAKRLRSKRAMSMDDALPHRRVRAPIPCLEGSCASCGQAGIARNEVEGPRINLNLDRSMAERPLIARYGGGSAVAPVVDLAIITDRQQEVRRPERRHQTPEAVLLTHSAARHRTVLRG